MPLNYIDPTGSDAIFNNDAAANRLFSNFEQEVAGTYNTKRSGLNNLRTGIDFTGDRRQAYTLNEIVTGVLGGDKNAANSIISNFITTSDSPFNVREHFFDVLQSWECSMPLNSMWLVYFTVPEIVRDEVMGAWGEHIVQLQARGETTDELEGGINLARRRFIENDQFTKTLGCALAQGLQLPQEQINTDHVGIPNSRGFLPTPVITQRQRFASLNIEFLETNVSFVDFLLRPWAVLGSHFGSVARKATPITTDVMVINLARAGVNLSINPSSGREEKGGSDTGDLVNNRGFIPRKIWFFQGAQPINVDSQRHSYSSDADVDRRTVEWLFKRYQIYMPTQFESLFDDIHKDVNSKDQQDNFRDVYENTGKKRYQKVLEQGKKFMDGKDGDPNPLDNEHVGTIQGDGLARRAVPSKTLEQVIEQGSSDAFEYWNGNEVDASGQPRKWTINSTGIPEAPDKVYVPRKPSEGGGWDKEQEGDTRHYEPKRPYGQNADTDIDALNKSKEMTEAYGSGEVEWNPYLGESTPGDGEITAVDPETSAMGGFYGPDGGNRYQMDTNASKINPAKPYGLDMGSANTGKGSSGVEIGSRAWRRLSKDQRAVDIGNRDASTIYTEKLRQKSYAYGAGDNPPVPATPMGGFYGPDTGPRYQLDSQNGRIKPVGKGASAYTGKTDLLRIIFGI